MHNGLDYSHPHTAQNSAGPKRVTMPENSYTCQWLDSCGTLPPPIERRHGGMSINLTDCDHCSRHEPASTAWEAKHQ